jgi:hypothetical protein
MNDGEINYETLSESVNYVTEAVCKVSVTDEMFPYVWFIWCLWLHASVRKGSGELHGRLNRTLNRCGHDCDTRSICHAAANGYRCAGPLLWQ